MLLIAAASAGIGFMRLGVYLSEPSSSPLKADLIVALGGDGGYRVRRVVELYQAGWARRVLVTGLEASPVDSRLAYLEWRTLLLERSGVAPGDLFLDRESTNSRQEAINTRALMEREGWKVVLVVSDPPHMRRLDHAWRSAFVGSSLSYVTIAAPADWWRPDMWWRDEISAKYVFQEAIKLALYRIFE